MLAPNSGFAGRLHLQHEPTNGSAAALDILLIGGPDVAVHPAKRGRSTLPTLFQHLPAQIPEARCLFYEHGLSLGHLEISTLRDEAERLLESLEKLREATSSADRPLLLIGHSLGGILLKNALVKACSTPRAHHIIQCLAGVVFLGTPHPENAYVAKGFLTRLFEVFHIDRSGTRICFLEALSNDLRNLETEFRGTLRRCLPRLDLVSFYETVPLNGSLVVGLTDCILEPFVSIPLPADHEHLTSFESSTHPGYIILVSELKRLIATYTKNRPKIEKICPATGYSCAAKFNSVGSTHEHDGGPDSCSCSKFTPPHAGTTSWLCQDRRLKSWLTERDSNTLWIQGKPGSGKSTLTKFLVQRLEKKFLDERSTIIIHYFFDGSRHHLDHATTRLLVSLLQQVSTKHANAPTSGLQQETHPLKLDWPESFRTCREFLRQHLSRKLQSQSQVFLLVDGLDECSRDEVADVIDLCKSLGEGGRSSSMKFLFSSRPWPVPFGQGHVTVDLDLENRRSASIFIQHELANFMSIRNRWQDIQSLLDEIQTKAEYNLLWLSLILSLLNLMSEGDAQPSEQLISLPPTLEGTYKILTKELSERYDDTLRSIPNAGQMLSWLALAVRPLSFLELEAALSWVRYIALSETAAESRAAIQSLDIAKPLGIAERLSQSTGGMLRILYTHRGPEVQLIHDSARDFLLQRRMKELHVPLTDISRGRSMIHLEMARTCLRYILSHVSRVQTTEEFPSTILSQYPFLEYATSSWAAHAKAANSGSISDEEFLRYFPWPTDPEMRLVGLASSILRLSFGGSQETSSTFLHYAAYRGLDKPIRAFLELGPRGEARVSNIDKPTGSGRTPLHLAASMGHWSVVNCLLTLGADFNAKDAIYGNSVLHWVALSPTGEGKVQTLDYLIQADVDINDNSNGMTPLALAVAYGDTEVVSALLDAGANPNGMDHHRGLTALSLAIVHKQVTAVSQLLDANACLEYGDIRTGLTPLEMAIATRQQEVVFRLLGKGARVYSSAQRFAPQGQGPDNQDDRMWLDRMLLLFRDFVSPRFVECPAESGSTRGPCPNQPNEQAQRSPSCQKRKKRTCENPDQHDGDEDGDDDHVKRHKPSGYSTNDEDEDDDSYCCPYYARNRRKFHKKCSRRRWKPSSLHHILDHLKAEHYIRLCCRCQKIFPTDEQLKQHLQQQIPCPLGNRNYEDGYDQQQYHRLHDKKRGSAQKLGPDAFWKLIHHILFEDLPEADEVPNISRALDADPSLQRFENFTRRGMRDSPWLRREITAIIGRTNLSDDVKADSILSSIYDVPGSFSERWRRQREDQSMNQSKGKDVSLPNRTEKTPAKTLAHREHASERGRYPDSRISQSNLDPPIYNCRQTPRTSTSTTSNRGLDLLSDNGPSLPPPPIIGSAHPSAAQAQRPFPFDMNFPTPQQQAPAFAMQSWQTSPPYNPWQQYPGPNSMFYSAPCAGDNVTMDLLSTPHQHVNPLPIEGFALNPTAGHNIHGQFDTWSAIRNQQTCTQSSYDPSNLASNLGRPHTSATSQSQPEACDSGDQEALVGDLSITRFSELDQFPLVGYSNLSPLIGHDEDGDQEGEEATAPEG